MFFCAPFFLLLPFYSLILIYSSSTYQPFFFIFLSLYTISLIIYFADLSFKQSRRGLSTHIGWRIGRSHMNENPVFLTKVFPCSVNSIVEVGMGTINVMQIVRQVWVEVQGLHCCRFPCHLEFYSVYKENFVPQRI